MYTCLISDYLCNPWIEVVQAIQEFRGALHGR